MKPKIVDYDFYDGMSEEEAADFDAMIAAAYNHAMDPTEENDRLHTEAANTYCHKWNPKCYDNHKSL